MDTDGKIDALGRQYIGAVPPSTSGNYTPGVVNGGDGGRPGNNMGTGHSSPVTPALPSILHSLVVALCVFLLA